MNRRNLISASFMAGGIAVGALLTTLAATPKGFGITETEVSAPTSNKWQPLPHDGNDGPGMLKRYQEESKDLWYPLKVRLREANKDSVLRGFWLDRRMIDQIFGQGEGFDGIRIYFGKKHDAGKRQYSLVFIGTKPSQQLKKEGSEDGGLYFDYVDPCPTNCGSGK